MSERITNKWTKTTAEAYGDNNNTRKGIIAEHMYHKYANRAYDEVEYFPDDYKMQVQGIDFLIKKSTWRRSYGVDVKGNMNDKGTFTVDNTEDGWLRNPRKKNDRVCHVCVDTGWALEYDRKNMQSFLGDCIGEMVYLNPANSSIQSFTRSFKL